VLEAFAAAGLDADAFGFDYLPDRTDRLRDLVSRSGFAWVSANVRDGSRPDQVFPAAQGARLWVLRQVGGVRVGITGGGVILGSHQGPPTGYLAEPEVIRGTILSKPGHDMAALGQLDLVVRRVDGRVVRYGFQRDPISRDGPVSPAVRAILDRYLAAR
jgi:2',3'-cyclic-nucleotide 2'-phosphodiesterase (5'-nucleotidase family)